MNQGRKSDAGSGLDRRQFSRVAGAAAVMAFAGSPAPAQTSACNGRESSLQTGNGQWIYRVAEGWGQAPAGLALGGTHGGIAIDKTGHVYISTQSETGVLVYTPEGVLLKTIAHQYPEIHSMVFSEENGVEYLYCTVQKGTPSENWLFIKMKTDGTVVQKITAPPEAGFRAPNEWRLTAALPGPDGSIFIANGYGDSRIFRFDSRGQFLGSYSGRGSAEGLLNCSHGMSIDTRYGQPMLLICDRENRRLCHFDFDGKFVGTVTQYLRRPCQTSFYGDYVVVSELEGRVTILDKNNAPVAFLGDNPVTSQWANYQIDPNRVARAAFSAAHGCYIDANANIYVTDWNHTGRITRLVRSAV
jgi:outer membrane protein assembly factor BamB